MTSNRKVDKQCVQAIIYQLDKFECAQCPLQKPCRLTLALNKKDICQELKEQEEK